MKFEELKDYQETLKEIKRLNARARVEHRKLNNVISACNDPLVRSILIERYLKGYSWTAVANKIGGGITGDNCRMLVVRYMKSRRKR